MRKENTVQNLVIVLLAVSLLVMSVGFAMYSSQLNIEGEATFSKAKWDVHFDDTTFNDSASTVTAESTSVDDDSVTFEVTLPKPGDKYTFTINAVNEGTIDAKLTKVTLAGITDEEFVKYTVNVGGTVYDATTDGLDVALAAEASQTVTVEVEYVLPDDAANLPTDNDVTLTLTADLDYESAV